MAAKQYEDNATKIARDADRQRQQAYVDTEFAKKYLPQQQKANGVYGLGLSESSKIQLNNNYQSTLGSINSGYNRNKTDLTNNFDYLKNNMQSSAFSQANEYNKSMLDNREEATYNHLNSELGSGRYTIDDYKRELEAAQTRLNQENYNKLSGKWQDKKWEISAAEVDMYLKEADKYYKKLENDKYTYDSYKKIKEYLDSQKTNIGDNEYRDLEKKYYDNSEKRNEYADRLQVEREGKEFESYKGNWFDYNATFKDKAGNTYTRDTMTQYDGPNFGLPQVGKRDKIYTTNVGKFIWNGRDGYALLKKV